jgi:putative transposase
MPRRPRELFPGGNYHVFSRGNRKQEIFSDDRDYRLFLEIVRQVARRRDWSIFSFCLMPNHYHLLVQTSEGDLSRGMQAINGDYAKWFNDAHGFIGHLFQGRFGSVLVESDWHFLELTRYLALNPVRGGLCQRPADWPWSSYPILAEGMSSDLLRRERVLSFFGRDPLRAKRAFRAFIEDGWARPTDLFRHAGV